MWMRAALWGESVPLSCHSPDVLSLFLSQRYLEAGHDRAFHLEVVSGSQQIWGRYISYSRQNYFIQGVGEEEVPGSLTE